MTRSTLPRESEDSPTLPVAGDQQEELARRLEAGYDYIERMIESGHDVTRLEDFWIQLLRQYEAVCEGLAEAA